MTRTREYKAAESPALSKAKVASMTSWFAIAIALGSLAYTIWSDSESRAQAQRHRVDAQRVIWRDDLRAAVEALDSDVRWALINEGASNQAEPSDVRAQRLHKLASSYSKAVSMLTDVEPLQDSLQHAINGFFVYSKSNVISAHETVFDAISEMKKRRTEMLRILDKISATVDSTVFEKHDQVSKGSVRTDSEKADEAPKREDKLLEICLTAGLTIVGGVLVFVMGQSIDRFLIRPYHHLREIRARIATHLIFYADVYSNPGVVAKDVQLEVSSAIRQDAAEFTGAWNGFYRWVYPRRSVQEIQGALIGLSNGLSRSGAVDANIDRRDKLKKLLKVDIGD